MNTPFTSTVRVYLEDTDAGGLVYHTNYLKFAERARSDWLRSCGLNHQTLRANDQVTFVVRSLSVDFHKPARLDDLLTLATHCENIGRASLTMKQTIHHQETLLVSLTVKLALINHLAKPRPLPASLLQALQQHA